MILKLIMALFLIFLSLFLPKQIMAQENSSLYFHTSIYTTHYTPRDYHNNHQNLMGIEYHYQDKKLKGISYFLNSYRQPTWYFYSGRYYPLFERRGFKFNAKLTYGIIHGYDDEGGEHSTWMHNMGTFPGFVFGFGIEKGPYKLEIHPFADAGLITTIGIEF
ncbi:hypothetical protein LJ207_04935 [Halanaerobium sp. Z-7514]|uniref:DUF3575 domain-containing protein n=1 Tax=Halanaerobium polyolivorans TaxID=2886943 RepID=A0AAW4WUA0_9FIRM|nr:hypothetical protein [Halanaerobium polyolivorans]MCC3144670.1 hypothetical protein [Halanaerobium polyolivorans]RQD73259.1 MAG: hypothetical protein D5S01_08115 [Halanaerobium sp. MSAO_Bac5]